MLDNLIKSRSFEKDAFYLRKSIPFLSQRYNYLNNINYRTLSSQYIPNINSLISEAEASLDILNQAATAESIKEPIPNKLWLYWNSPLESAPDVVKRSVQSWHQQNPEFEVTFLCDENLEQILGFNFNTTFRLATVNLGLAMKADILRLYLLSKYGGVWVDTTTFCLKPLSHWLPEATKDTHFFTFRHSSNQTRPVEAWFIAANQGNKIVQSTLQLFLEHLFKQRKHSLFISNRIKKIGRRDNESNRFFLDTVQAAETKGFMPYFSVGYFFNESLNQPDTQQIWKKLQNVTNNHSVNNDSFEKFKSSFVSKQTYKKDYMDGEIYKQRVLYLEDLLHKLI